MKTRIQFHSLGKDSETPVFDAVSLTQPDMSLSIKEIVNRFAFLGDTPMGMFEFAPPEIKEDEKLFNGVDVERLDIAELEELAYQLNQRAEYLRGQDPRPVPPAGENPDGPPAENPDGPAEK